ncbi:peptidase [Amycolatopsis sp. WAC 04197]|uniref:S1 family peptidase n=1 Tax=Amycolatopsis sp. WAC 04197 TaxID=2203199 RepID=UPI000F780D1F|nr:S1 family peptidase [Amycolatopsis sp. WAC 04197]RSN39696.1 peptidase [Amycolatopsis sp. WAC 04197]
MRNRRLLTLLTALIALFAATVAVPATAGAQRVVAIEGATQVADSLGFASGGVHLENGKAVVSVVDGVAERKVRAAGLTAKKVKRSFSALTAVKNELDKIKNVPQTAWGIDTSTNQVVVSIYDSATKATADRVTAAAAKYGDSVRVERRTGKLSLHIAGGEQISSSAGTNCSLGFNVTRDGQPFMLTAGHCTNAGGTWSGGDVTGAPVVASNSPGADTGLLARPNGTGPGQIVTGQRITSAAVPLVGQQIQSHGKTTGTRAGRILAVNQSVNTNVGVINNTFIAEIVTLPGDSGGPAYAGTRGLGTLSGGDDRVSFYYPLTLAMQAYRLRLA